MTIEKIEGLFNKYKEVILYLFFGGCTTLVNIVAYYLCDKIRLSTTVSTIIAWILSVLFAYVTNRKYVFENRDESKSVIKEISQFFSCRLATGILDLAIMVLFVDVLKYNGMIIKIISNILVIILNYIFSKLVIFKNRNKER